MIEVVEVKERYETVLEATQIEVVELGVDIQTAISTPEVELAERGIIVVQPGGGGGGAENIIIQSFVVAASDETTNLSTGTAKATFRIPYAFTLTAVRASLSTASSSGLVVVDITKNGASIMGTNKLSIDATERTSVTAATPPNLIDTNLTDDAEISVNITSAGTGAKGLKISLIGYPT